ncbi:hypothetical protein MTO96_043911 [Rhipicephalus appendiculatus]
MSIATKSLDERQMGSGLTLLRGCKTQCGHSCRTMYAKCKKIGESEKDSVGVATTRLTSQDTACTLCGDTLPSRWTLSDVTDGITKTTNDLA